MRSRNLLPGFTAFAKQVSRLLLASADPGRRRELQSRMVRSLQLVDRILLTRHLSLEHLTPGTQRAYLFVKHAAGILPGQSLHSVPVCGTNGHYHDLLACWKMVNEGYFQGAMVPKSVRWSQRASFQRLGFWDPGRDHIVISKSLDHPSVPAELIQYILYHEGLHKYLGLEHREGGRRFHTPTFRRLERLFPDWKTHEVWLRAEWPKLVRSSLV